MVLIAKVTILPDGGQELSVWDMDGNPLLKTIEILLGPKQQTFLLSSEQVVNSRAAMGQTLGAIHGDLAEIQD